MTASPTIGLALFEAAMSLTKAIDLCESHLVSPDTPLITAGLTPVG